MGIRFRSAVEGQVYRHAAISLGATLRRVAEKHLPTMQNGISVEMFTSNGLPYEVPRTYSTIMTECQCRRAQTAIEAQRALSRL